MCLQLHLYDFFPLWIFSFVLHFYDFSLLCFQLLLHLYDCALSTFVKGSQSISVWWMLYENIARAGMDGSSTLLALQTSFYLFQPHHYNLKWSKFVIVVLLSSIIFQHTKGRLKLSFRLSVRSPVCSSVGSKLSAKASRPLYNASCILWPDSPKGAKDKVYFSLLWSMTSFGLVPLILTNRKWRGSKIWWNYIKSNETGLDLPDWAVAFRLVCRQFWRMGGRQQNFCQSAAGSQLRPTELIWDFQERVQHPWTKVKNQAKPLLNWAVEQNIHVEQFCSTWKFFMVMCNKIALLDKQSCSTWQ